jgi:phage recombination protein Bet
MTSNAIAPLTSDQIAHGTSFSAVQVDLIRDQIMPGASNDELMLFVQVASSRGLDPFRKHIYAVSRRSKEGNNWIDKWSYQVSIDGLRLIAERSGRYEGQTLPQWCGPDGIWREVWLEDGPPAAAKVGVYIKGAREPLYAIALYRTFVQKTREGEPTKFWKEMPEHMLAKVAESQALRKAFPEEAGGLYTPEEMDRGGEPVYTDVIDHATGEVVRESRQRQVSATVSQSDEDRKAAKSQLWDLANRTYVWDQETLEAVAVDETGISLRAMDAAQLRDLAILLATESPEERQERVDRATAIESPQLAIG